MAGFDVPQFRDGGPKVLVKNTFLTTTDMPEDDLLAPPPLERSRTAPAASRQPDSDDELDAEATPSPTAEARGRPAPVLQSDGSDDEENVGNPAEVPPAGLALTRCITRDYYENSEDWQWASQETAMAAPMPVGSMPMAGMMPMGGNMVPIQGQAMPIAAQPMCYQMAMPVMMVPMLVPVGPASGSLAGDCRGYGQPQMPTPESSGDNSPGFVVPPPPDFQPGLERVPSCSGPAPQFSPQWSSQGGGLAASLAAAAVGDEAAKPASSTDAAVPAAGDLTIVRAPAPPQPQTLTRTFSNASCTHRIHWHVDARKLKGNDKQAVSPAFELYFGPDFPSVTFKMMIYPKVVSDTKGGASFKKAKGKGFVQLKCEAELSEAVATVAFRIGCGQGALTQAMRGAIRHNFSHSAVCGLPKDQEEWDFTTVVCPESQTFLVILEIVPQPLQ